MSVEEALFEELRVAQSEISELRESLGDAMASIRFEDKSWLALFGLTDFDKLEGMSIQEVQEIAERMRVKTALGGLYKRGADLHTGYTWARGINIPGIEAKGTSGRPSALRAFYRRNYEELFSSSAHAELQKCRYTDGNILALCVPGEQVRFIPFSEVQDVKINPEFPSEIWAYLREWTPDTAKPNQKQQFWYYTKRYTGNKQDSYLTGGKRIKVARGVIVDKGFNKQKGWVLGIPDVAAAAPWIEAYNEIMQYGRVVNEALSRMLYKIVSPTKKAASNASAKVANMKGHGNTASMAGEGADVTAISTAGKGYDFTSARPVGAEGAAALNVSLAEFLSDTSAAGSSYGALAALAPSVQNAMIFMQNEWIDFYTEIFDAYSLPVPEMSFDPITEPDLYRLVQAITLGSTALSDEEYRKTVLDAFNIDGNAAEIPPTLEARGVAAQQAASPDQGRNSPAGSTDSGQRNDQRSDTISEALSAMKLDEFRELVERMEAATANSR